MKSIKENLFLKDFLAKLPVFLFCVVFIHLHNSLFGAENSVIGVAILVGLFMTLESDFAFRTKDVVITIPILYLIVALSPKLSSFNIYLGLLINFISIFLIMIISSHNVTAGNHLSFMLGYLFCQGYELSGSFYTKRVVSLLIGGVLIALIYYFINKNKEFTIGIRDIFKSITLKSATTQWSLKLAISISLVTFVGELLNYPKTMWINLAIFSLITVSQDDHVTRRRYRIPGTILGCFIFWLLFTIIIPIKYQNGFILAAGFLSMFITSYFVKTIYNSFSALVTAVVLFPTSDAIVIRIISNIFGVILAITFNFALTKLFSTLHQENIECPT